MDSPSSWGWAARPSRCRAGYAAAATGSSPSARGTCPAPATRPENTFPPFCSPASSPCAATSPARSGTTPADKKQHSSLKMKRAASKTKTRIALKRIAVKVNSQCHDFVRPRNSAQLASVPGCGSSRLFFFALRPLAGHVRAFRGFAIVGCVPRFRFYL